MWSYLLLTAFGNSGLKLLQLLLLHVSATVISVMQFTCDKGIGIRFTGHFLFNSLNN